jgi:hypothetical protein
MPEQNKPWFARLYDAMNAADMKTLQDAIENPREPTRGRQLTLTRLRVFATQIA